MALCLGLAAVAQPTTALPHPYLWEENGKFYWSPRDRSHSVALNVKAAGNLTAVPFTSKCLVFTGNHSVPLASSLLDDFVKSYGSTDDVWSKSFLDFIIIQGCSAGPISEFVASSNITTVFTDRISNAQLSKSVAFYTIQGNAVGSLSNGPYVASVTGSASVELSPVYAVHEVKLARSLFSPVRLNCDRTRL